MAVQQLEGVRNRKEDEVARRNLQVRTNRSQNIWAEKKLISRSVAKDFLRFLKRDTFQVAQEIGLLRSAFSNKIESDYFPALYGQAYMQQIHEKDYDITITESVSDGLQLYSLSHKNAILKEMKRRQNEQDEKERLKNEAEAAKKQRKEKRMCLREINRIQILQDAILETFVKGAP